MLAGSLRRYQRPRPLCIGFLLFPLGHAQAVALAGVLGSKALLLVNPPRGRWARG